MHSENAWATMAIDMVMSVSERVIRAELPPVQPSLMSAVRIGSWQFAGKETIVDVPPVLGRGVRRIDSEGLNTVDCLKNLLDLRPTTEVEQALAARAHKWDGRIAFALLNGAQDIDTRHGGAVVVGCPAHERENGVCCERDDAMLPIEHVLLDRAAEADPVLNALLEPGQLDVSEARSCHSPCLARLEVVLSIAPAGRVRMSGARSLGRAPDVHRGRRPRGALPGLSATTQ